ncbi:hypothetical protein HY407_04760 [Candidatus Gottesmanbacteria bacterium]|nr:hypothetical protein [Candidatus Gottesmanbacteria bacterium]
MNTTIIQVPISKSLRNEALREARASGFSSIQDAIRMFLQKLAKREIGVIFEPKPIKLSPKNDRRYAKMINDVLSGKVKPYVAKDVDDLMRQLHGENN